MRINITKKIDPNILEIVRHAKNYFSAIIALKFIGVFIWPVLTRLLSKDDYGTYALFQSYLGLGCILFPLYLYSSVGRYYYEEKDDKEYFIGSTIILSFLSYLLFLSLLLLFPGILKQSALLSTSIWFFILAIIPTKILSSIYYQILVPLKESKKYSRIQITEGVITITLILFFSFLINEHKYKGPIWGVCVASLIMGIYYLSFLIKHAKFSLNINHFRYIINYSIPQLPYALSAVILEQIGRIIIGETSNMSDVGIYSIGFQFGMIVTYFSSAIRTAYMPSFYEHMNNKNYSAISKLWTTFFSLFVIFNLFTMYFAKEGIMILTSKEYYDAVRIVPWVVLAYTFFDMFYIYSPYIEYKKQTGILSIIVITGGIINIFATRFFIEIFGYIGASYATATSYFAMFIITKLILIKSKNFKTVPFSTIRYEFIILIVFFLLLQIIVSSKLNFFLCFCIRLFFFLSAILLLVYKNRIKARS